MAKPTQKAPEAMPAPPTPPAMNGFIFNFGPPPPPARRGPVGREPSKFNTPVQNLQPPQGGQMHSFFVAAEVPAGINPAERETAMKEAQRKLANNINSVTRRQMKSDEASNYTIRPVTENGVAGVRVWRTDAERREPVKRPRKPQGASPTQGGAAFPPPPPPPPPPHG